MKKLRADSTFSKLTPEQRVELDELLTGGCSYADAQAALARMGFEASITAIADYYHNHVLPVAWAKRQRLAVQLGAMDSAGLDEATLTATKQTVMEMAMTPGADPKMFRMLYNITLAARAQAVEERKVALMERKAAAADAAKAAVENAALTPEEKEARLKEIFGLL